MQSKNENPSPLTHRTNSREQCNLRSRSSFFRSLGTHLALTFDILSSFRQSWTVDTDTPSSLDISRTVCRRSYFISCQTLSFTPIFTTDGRSHRLSSSIDSLPFQNMLCHLNTSDLQHLFVVLDAWIILYVSVGVFSIPTQNLMIGPTSTSPIDVIFLLICVSTSDVKTVVIQKLVLFRDVIHCNLRKLLSIKYIGTINLNTIKSECSGYALCGSYRNKFWAVFVYSC
jgi:hypothetical protein